MHYSFVIIIVFLLLLLFAFFYYRSGSQSKNIQSSGSQNAVSQQSASTQNTIKHQQLQQHQTHRPLPQSSLQSQMGPTDDKENESIMGNRVKQPLQSSYSNQVQYTKEQKFYKDSQGNEWTLQNVNLPNDIKKDIIDKFQSHKQIQGYDITDINGQIWKNKTTGGISKFIDLITNNKEQLVMINYRNCEQQMKKDFLLNIVDFDKYLHKNDLQDCFCKIYAHIYIENKKDKNENDYGFLILEKLDFSVKQNIIPHLIGYINLLEKITQKSVIPMNGRIEKCGFRQGLVYKFSSFNSFIFEGFQKIGYIKDPYHDIFQQNVYPDNFANLLVQQATEDSKERAKQIKQEFSNTILKYPLGYRYILFVWVNEIKYNNEMNGYEGIQEKDPVFGQNIGIIVNFPGVLSYIIIKDLYLDEFLGGQVDDIVIKNRIYDDHLLEQNEGYSNFFQYIRPIYSFPKTQIMRSLLQNVGRRGGKIFVQDLQIKNKGKNGQDHFGITEYITKNIGSFIERVQIHVL